VSNLGWLFVRLAWRSVQEWSVGWSGGFVGCHDLAYGGGFMGCPLGCGCDRFVPAGVVAGETVISAVFVVVSLVSLALSLGHGILVVEMAVAVVWVWIR